jgi:chromosome partitioning protein
MPGVEDTVSQATSQERKIPVVSLASTKGGVGKTTLAYVLATEVARRLAHAISGAVSPPRPVLVNPSAAVWRGRVTCIDADPNRTLAQVLQLTRDRLITCVESDSERLLADLRNAQTEADLIVIDLEGTANQAMLYAAGKSDLVLVPAQPSRFDVVEAVKTVGVVRKAADLVGRDIAHRVVLSRTPVLRQRVADHSRAQFERAELPLLPVELVQRAAFQSMTYTGQPPWRQDGGEQAAANVASLADEVLNIVGLDLPPVTRQDPQDTEGARALQRASWSQLQDVQTVA